MGTYGADPQPDYPNQGNCIGQKS